MSEMWLGKGDGKKSRGRGRGKKRLNDPISRDDDISTDLLKKVKLKVAIITTPPTILPNFKSLCQPPRLVRSAFPSGYELPRYPPVTCWGERFIFFQSLTCETP